MQLRKSEERAAPQEARALEEKDLTEKQREWLALSRKIGPGAMTKTERESLEKAYAEMMPKEQQDLHQYIVTTYGKKEKDDTDSDSASEDPIAVMEKMVWVAPSDSLKTALSKAQKPKPRSSGNKS
jgi:hypothetical protein